MFFEFDDDGEYRRAPASFFLSFFRFFFSQARQFKTSFDDDDDDEIAKLESSLKTRTRGEGYKLLGKRFAWSFLLVIYLQGVIHYPADPRHSNDKK